MDQLCSRHPGMPGTAFWISVSMNLLSTRNEVRGSSIQVQNILPPDDAQAMFLR